MDLNLSESQLILRNAARDFLSAEFPSSLAREMESDPKGYPVKLWQQIVEMGWLGIVVPGEYGGHDSGFLDLLVLLQEMGRAALPGPFFSTTVLAGLAILEGGSGEQKRALLPRLCSGDLLMSLALSEPGVDFGMDDLATTAVEQNGQYWITGTKVFVPDAHVADLLVCITSGAGSGKTEEGVSAFLVKTASPGVLVTLLETNLRDRQFEVVFTDVRAERHEAVGSVGRARAWMERVLEKAMVAKCAEMVGAGQKVLEMTVDYAKVRVQFDKPIGALQAIQHHCANLATCIETAELMTYRAGWMIEQGLPCRREALQAKSWTNEACKRAAALGHQVHGGMGFTREYDLYLYSHRMTAFARLMGGTDWCYDRIADEIGLVMSS
jgi:alkylation response protein AidB-like acyl-CoA dehydrogenase